VPVDAWGKVALLAGPVDSLPMQLMCWGTRAGLRAIGAHLHKVRGYLVTRKDGVEFHVEYFVNDHTALGQQAREERMRKNRRTPGAPKRGAARYEPTNGMIIHWPYPTTEGGLSRGDN